MPYNIQKDFIEPGEKVMEDIQPKETTITKEQLNTLWNALQYTLATISGGYDFPSMEGKMDYQLIHKGRAHQSNAFLNQALEIINQLKRELK